MCKQHSLNSTKGVNPDRSTLVQPRMWYNQYCIHYIQFLYSLRPFTLPSLSLALPVMSMLQFQQWHCAISKLIILVSKGLQHRRLNMSLPLARRAPKWKAQTSHRTALRVRGFSSAGRHPSLCRMKMGHGWVSASVAGPPHGADGRCGCALQLNLNLIPQLNFKNSCKHC